jgi:hypothetical protein
LSSAISRMTSKPSSSEPPCGPLGNAAIDVDAEPLDETADGRVEYVVAERTVDGSG